MNREYFEGKTADAEWKAPEENSDAQSPEIPERNKSIIEGELEGVEIFLQRLDEGDDSTAYADTGDPMQIVDDLLGGNPRYEALRPMRQEAVRLGMSQDTEEMKDGVVKTREWAVEVRKIIE